VLLPESSLRPALYEALQEADAIMQAKLAEFIETLRRIAEPTDDEIDALRAYQAGVWAQERAEIERKLRSWLERGGETLQ